MNGIFYVSYTKYPKKFNGPSKYFSSQEKDSYTTPDDVKICETNLYSILLPQDMK